MIVSLWSLKGGVGCSVMAALTALHRAGSSDEPTLLVDIRGDQPAVLGLAPSSEAGIADWFERGPIGPPDALGRLAGDVAPGLQLIGRGNAAMPAIEPDERFLRQLDELPGTVIVDAGLVVGTGATASLARWMARHGTRSVLVTTACYLALSRLADAPLTPSGVLLVREAGRALGAADVEDVVGAPVLVEIAHDAAIGRAVDAGLLSARPPRGVGRALGRVA